MLTFRNSDFIVSLDTHEMYMYSSMIDKVNQATLRPNLNVNVS